MTPQRLKAVIIGCLAVVAIGLGGIAAVLLASEDGPLSARPARA